MLKDYLRKNFHWLVYWGIVLQFACGLTEVSQPYLAVVGWVISLTSTILLMVGFAFYAKAKGRSPVWCLLALLPIVGWVIIILIKDKNAILAFKDRKRDIE
jgi:hypothetical protein